MEYNSEATTNGDKGDEDERKIFVGGLSWESTDKDMRTYFEKFGTIEKVTLKTDPMTGESRGFGFILYEDKASIDSVMAETTHTLNGKKIGPRRAKSRPKPDPILKVFVGGLEPTVTEETLRAHFEAFGTISEIILPVDKESNERRAFGFIKYESEEIVNAVIASNDSQGKQNIGGKDYDIKKHTPKDQFGGRGGGRGGRGSFGGQGRGTGGGYGGGFGAYGGGYGGGYDAGYGAGYGGGYEDYSASYGGGYDASYGGAYDYSQDYFGGGAGGYDYSQGYGAPAGGFGKAPRARGRGRGRGRGFAPY